MIGGQFNHHSPPGTLVQRTQKRFDVLGVVDHVGAQDNVMDGDRAGHLRPATFDHARCKVQFGTSALETGGQVRVLFHSSQGVTLGGMEQRSPPRPRSYIQQRAPFSEQTANYASGRVFSALFVG